MQFTRCGTVSTQLVFTSFASDKEESFGKKCAKCFDFLIDVRCHLVGNSQDKVLLSPLDFLLPANLKHGSAGSAADSMRIDEVICAIVQRMKWDVVKNMMRNNY